MALSVNSTKANFSGLFFLNLLLNIRKIPDTCSVKGAVGSMIPIILPLVLPHVYGKKHDYWIGDHDPWLPMHWPVS